MSNYLDKQFRDVAFTYNNPPMSKEELRDRLISEFGTNLKYVIIGFEVGDNAGTPHYQCFMQLDKKVRGNTISRVLDKSHFEARKGSVEQNIKYCNEDGDFIEYGTPNLKENHIGKHNTERWKELFDLAVQGRLEDLQEKYPGEYIRYHRALHAVRVEGMRPLENEKICIYLYGKPGCGKSRFARCFDENAYWKNPNKWWDNFSEQKTVIIDDFDKSHKVLGYHLKRWADRYPVLAETKGSSTYVHYNTLIITSNYTIDDIWSEDPMLAEALKRRFHVYQVMSFEIDPEGRLILNTYENGDPFKPKVLDTLINF